MDYINILLVGAGQLGSRHLQGLGAGMLPLKIEVVDPSEKSLEVARDRFGEVAPGNTGTIVNFSRSLESVKQDSFEVAIIATNSDVRDRVVNRMLDLFSIKYLVLEKVAYQSEKIYREQMERINDKAVKAWVNCPRRLYPFYRSLRDQLAGEKSLYISVEGGNWGLGCNSIHFIDLFAYLSGSNDISLNFSSLDRGILESKRKGFIEFSGTLGFKADRGELILVDNLNTAMPAQVTITGKGSRYIINEYFGEVQIRDIESGITRSDNTSRFPFQSELTGRVIEDIVKKGECGLTSMAESCLYHSLLLEPLTDHLSLVSGVKHLSCPIT